MWRLITQHSHILRTLKNFVEWRISLRFNWISSTKMRLPNIFSLLKRKSSVSSLSYVSSIPDEFLDLRNDSSAHDLFKVKFVTQFWCVMYQPYTKVSVIVLSVLVPFAFTYLCEAGFSTLVNIKTKNRLDVGDDMRLALTNARPRISKLAAQMQHLASH